MTSIRRLLLSITIISLCALAPLSVFIKSPLPIPLILVLVFAILKIKRSLKPIEILLILIILNYGAFAFFNEYFILRIIQSTFIWLIFRVSYLFFNEKRNLNMMISLGLFIIPTGTLISVWYFMNGGVIPWSSFTDGEYSSRIDLFELPAGWSSGPVEYGYTIAPWIPLFVYMYYLSSRSIIRVISIFAAFLIFANLLFIGSRSALLAFGVSFIIFLIKSTLTNRVKILSTLVPLLLLVLSRLDLTYLSSKILDISESSDSRLSLDMILEFLRIVHFQAPFGYHFNEQVFQDYLTRNNGYSPHNFLLSAFWEGGLIIGYIVIIIAALSLRQIWLGIYRGSMVSCLLTLPLLMIMIHSCFHNNSLAITSFVWPVFLVFTILNHENRFSINGG